MAKFILKPGHLTIADIKLLLDEKTTLELDSKSHIHIKASETIVTNILKTDKSVYGINTGFGALANTRIQAKDLKKLQTSIVLSHAAGTGENISDQASRLMLALKINSLARGFSGVRLSTIDALIQLFNAHIYPCIPAQGSVGASGDLAPLAHMSAVLLGIGDARHHEQTITAHTALKKIKLTPLKLAPKEGLALLNGTQFSTAVAILALLALENVFVAAIASGALSVEAMRASDVPFDERIQQVRGFQSQSTVAQWLRDLLRKSEIRHSHIACSKVQDPYSLRCQPQVMGAALTQILYAYEQLMIEANAVSDNPLIFSEQNEVLSGGNFHAQPVGFACDALAISIAEIGSLAERRIALLIDHQFSGLPAFLVKNAGVNSGFMVAHVTAVALASENKSFAQPASIDSLPTSANQEDHVSMAAYAARRLHPMVKNAAVIIGIELLSAAQGIDFLSPLKTSQSLQKIHTLIRKLVPFYEEDRYFAPDIAKMKKFVQSGEITRTLKISIWDH